MLTIACVKWGTLYGPEYVNHLHDMVRRNLPEGTEGRFVCLTDDRRGLAAGIDIIDLPRGLIGWWNKLALFKPGMFPTGSRVVYFDLDTVITGGLDDIVRYDGNFAILRDFYRGGDALQSSVMSWRAGYFDTIWARWDGVETRGGDQDWIERHFKSGAFEPDRWQDVLPGQFVSYKADNCKEMFPRGARVVVFHGRPRPHECDGWVPKVWCIGGGSSLELEVVSNVASDALLENVRRNARRFPWLESAPSHDRHVCLVGGGPSLAEFVGEITQRQKHGQEVWALNNSWRFLEANGVRIDAQLMLDGRPENRAFVAPAETPKYYASQVHPSVADADPESVRLWHTGMPGVQYVLHEVAPDKGHMQIGGGTSVGLLGISLAYAMGYRNIHLYGYDSSYRGDAGHAYAQSLNDGERVIDIECDGRKFRAAPWMASQVDEFTQMAPQLVLSGVTLTVHGDGLLPTVAAMFNRPRTPDTEIALHDGIWWPSKDIEARPSVAATLGDIDTILGLTKGRKVAVQAGGNVGLWPRELAGHFEAVYTFEPDWLNFKCLARNVEAANVVKMQAALGHVRKMIDLERDPGNCGAHYIGGSGIVPTIRIDDLGLEACDLIALDIEGFELNALRGAYQTIKQFSPTIVVEDKGLSEKFGSKKGDIEKYLGASFGYRVASRVNRDIILIKGA